MVRHRGRGSEGAAHTVAAPGGHVGQAFARPASVTDQPRVDPHPTSIVKGPTFLDIIYLHSASKPPNAYLTYIAYYIS
jgi:hypothetical protein